MRYLVEHGSSVIRLSELPQKILDLIGLRGPADEVDYLDPAEDEWLTVAMDNVCEISYQRLLLKPVGLQVSDCELVRNEIAKVSRKVTTLPKKHSHAASTSFLPFAERPNKRNATNGAPAGDPFLPIPPINLAQRSPSPVFPVIDEIIRDVGNKSQELPASTMPAPTTSTDQQHIITSFPSTDGAAMIRGFLRYESLPQTRGLMTQMDRFHTAFGNGLEYKKSTFMEHLQYFRLASADMLRGILNGDGNSQWSQVRLDGKNISRKNVTRLKMRREIDDEHNWKTLSGSSTPSVNEDSRITAGVAGSLGADSYTTQSQISTWWCSSCRDILI